MPRRILSLLLLCCLLFLSSCLQLPKDPETTADPTHKSYYETATYVYKTNVEEVLPSIMTGLSSAYLTLVNKTHTVDKNSNPAQLTTLPTARTNGGKTVQVEARAATALLAMMDEMAAEGIYPKVTSGHRDYAYQEYLFNHYLSVERATITSDARAFLGADYIQQNYTSRGLKALNEEDARRVVLSYSAYPGTSEHQTGLAVDFVAADGAPLDLSFESSAAFRWLSVNAYKFGFVLRFPADKTAVTGYSYEPWHYRFVGREAATDIYMGGLTLEEYLGQD